MARDDAERIYSLGCDIGALTHAIPMDGTRPERSP